MTIVNPAYDFLKADYENPNLSLNFRRIIDENVPKRGRSLLRYFPYILPAATLLTPVTAFAATDTFVRITSIFLTGADYLFVFVVIFAGASWMLGNRSKAIELILGAASGYLVIRHANDLLAILKTI